MKLRKRGITLSRASILHPPFTLFKAFLRSYDMGRFGMLDQNFSGIPVT